jgi:hypothetical protein
VIPEDGSEDIFVHRFLIPLPSSALLRYVALQLVPI